MNSPAHACLNGLLEHPGVRDVLLIDHTGDCLAHCGNTDLSPAKLTVWSVLARASFGSGDELGRRADAGSCREITNLHERGGSILRLISGGQLLVVHFSAIPALATLRIAVREASERLAAAFIPARMESPRDCAEALDPESPSASHGAVLFEAYDAPEDGAIDLLTHAMCHED